MSTDPSGWFDPLDFLKLAEKLVKAETESAFRSATSRAYYAIFLYIRERLKEVKFLRREEARSHKAVADALIKRSDLRSIGRTLSDFRAERNIADYDVTRSYSQEKAEEQCQMAQSLLKEFQEAVTKAAFH